jgi:hypothetical protein
MEQWKRGAVLAIDANTQAPKLDLFCRSPSRVGVGPDSKKAIRKDGPFYVYKEPLAAGEVYINEGGLKIFGGTATSWVYEDPLAKMTHPTEAESYLFALALTDVTRLSTSVVTYQVSVEEMPRMFDTLERQIRSWLIEPNAQDFLWYHQRPGACEN